MREDATAVEDGMPVTSSTAVVENSFVGVDALAIEIIVVLEPSVVTDNP